MTRGFEPGAQAASIPTTEVAGSRDPGDLESKLRSPGYTPARRDIGRLLELLSSATDDVAKLVSRALTPLGDAVLAPLMSRFEGSRPPERGRLVALAGRIAVQAAEAQDASLHEWLIQRLSDPDPVSQRRAITALGKISGPGVEDALLSAWTDLLPPPERRALVVALGNVGGARSFERLAALSTEDAELRRIASEAQTKIERSLLRRAPGIIDPKQALPRPVPILLHVRAGLEDVLLDELGKAARGRVVGPGRVEIVSADPVDHLFRARTFLHFGFPLPPELIDGDDPSSAVIRALGSDAAWEILSALTPAPIRYRIEWASGGRRKTATLRVGAGVRVLRPGLVNDATAAPWEAVVTERGDGAGRRVFVELWPRALPDPRFSYRRRLLPASSHPTIAAALAHVASVVPNDVVWDPFVGSGIELCERALLGPYAELFGSDLDAGVLEAARENLTRALALRFTLVQGDARSYRPPRAPTLIITNPPFGRRVLERDALMPLFDWFLENAVGALTPSGRLVWVSPLPDATVKLADGRGLVVRERRPVDVGGVPGEIQLFVRKGARPTP